MTAMQSSISVCWGTEVLKKYCPKCKKRRNKVSMFIEIIGKWWVSEGFYVADDSKADRIQAMKNV